MVYLFIRLITWLIFFILVKVNQTGSILYTGMSEYFFGPPTVSKKRLSLLISICLITGIIVCTSIHSWGGEGAICVMGTFLKMSRRIQGWMLLETMFGFTSCLPWILITLFYVYPSKYQLAIDNDKAKHPTF